MTLDFTNPESAKKSLQTQTPELLSFLRLTSPELEKFLTQGFAQGVSVVQTPTPTQFFFPKNVTAEQEQYARGFLDALNQIYQRSGFIPVNNNILSPGFVANTVAQEAKEGGGKDGGKLVYLCWGLGCSFVNSSDLGLAGYLHNNHNIASGRVVIITRGLD